MTLDRGWQWDAMSTELTMGTEVAMDTEVTMSTPVTMGNSMAKSNEHWMVDDNEETMGREGR